LECVVNEGDIIYLPAYWWHEVRSEPDRASQSRNVAINYWFEPFFTKEFPCSNCRPQFNADMLHLISTYFPQSTFH